jgi:hypothetical protein
MRSAVVTAFRNVADLLSTGNQLDQGARTPVRERSRAAQAFSLIPAVRRESLFFPQRITPRRLERCQHDHGPVALEQVEEGSAVVSVGKDGLAIVTPRS